MHKKEAVEKVLKRLTAKVAKFFDKCAKN